MEKRFEIYKDKLNVDFSTDPEISFGHIGLKNQDGEDKGEFFAFTYSYLIKDEKDIDKLKSNENIPLSMDIEMSNLIRTLTYFQVTKEEESMPPYSFTIAQRPLMTMEEYVNVLKEEISNPFERSDKEIENPLEQSDKENEVHSEYNEDINEIEEIDDESELRNVYIRMCLCVASPSVLQIPEEVALDMGVDFLENYDMENVDILRLQTLYNEYVDKKENLKSTFFEKTYYFYLDNLGSLLDMPFRSKGKVYENNKIGESKYIYETDTALFDYLDEYDKSPILLREMNVVVKDVSKLVEVITKK